MKRLELSIDAVLCLLAVTLCFRLLTPSSSLIEIATEAENPRTLHHPDSSKTLLPIRLQAVGQYITVEDLIRYLEHHPDMVRQNSQAVALLQRMLDRQSDILKTEEEIQAIEQILNQTALKLYEELSESEKQILRSQRNVDSVEGIEAVYWKSLLEELETK